MDVHAVARLGGVEQRREARAQLVPAGDLAHHLPEHHAAVGRREPSAAATGISNWWAANSAKKRSGCTPASASAPHDVAWRTVRRGAAASSENGGAGRRVAQQLELVLEARHQVKRRAPPRARASASRRKRRGQHSHGVTVGLDDVAQHELQRHRRPCARLHAHAGVGVGQQAQVAVEPNGLGSASGPSGVSAWLAGTQPTPASQVRVRARMRAASARARSRRGRSRRARPARGALSDRAALTRAIPGVTVPLSQMPSARPSAPAPARTAGRPATNDDDEHAARGHVAPLDRGGETLARLQVHAAAARARGRCRRRRRGCHPGPAHGR